MTDDTLNALLAKVAAINSEIHEGYTWWDADPEVAWGEPESLHGRWAALYLEAGWTRCYHGDAVFHYDVKLHGMGANHALWNAIREVVPPEGTARIDEIVTMLEEDELDNWWTHTTPYFIEELRPNHALAPRSTSGVRPQVWSCGRGGWLNAPDYERDPEVMIRLAGHLAESVRYYTSAEWGEYLASEALELDRDSQMAALASPRPDRIEA